MSQRSFQSICSKFGSFRVFHFWPFKVGGKAARYGRFMIADRRTLNDIGVQGVEEMEDTNRSFWID